MQWLGKKHEKLCRDTLAFLLRHFTGQEVTMARHREESFTIESARARQSVRVQEHFFNLSTASKCKKF